MLKKILGLIMFMISVLLVLYCSKNHKWKTQCKQRKYEIVEVEVGDILYRSNSYFFANSRWYKYSGYPGHLAIVVNDGKVSPDEKELANIMVAEARYRDHRLKVSSRKVSIQSGSENFGDYKGRRLLLKTHLSEEQKKKVVEYVKLHENKPYKFFDSKKEDLYFNCATLVRNAILYATGEDIDSNGGVVFPTDIVRNNKFKSHFNRINF